MSLGLLFNIALIAKFVPRAALFVNYKTNLASVLFLLKASSFKIAKSKLYPQIVVKRQGGPKKRGNKLMTIILSNLTRFTFFSLKFFLVNLQLNAY